MHGKNKEMYQSVARLLTTIGLNPIILHEKPNLGDTIIEKFEKHSEVGTAIVLLSADDEIVTTEKPKLYRARQNVIFEMGFFIGKLGRKSVIAILQTDKNVEKPSDYDGVLYIPFDKEDSWRTRISKEPKELKCDVDMNNL